MRHARPRRRSGGARGAVLAAVAAFAAAWWPAAVASAEGEAAPRLVVLLAIDQLGRDRLDPSLPGGLGRLAREGRVYAEAVVDHAGSETCPGHVALATGRHPGHAGVPGNRFIDRASGRAVYCVEDDPATARVFGEDEGRSPRLVRVDALGDWLLAARPGARVFGVSGKDRAAIALAGRRPTGAFWYGSGDPPHFTSSRYYAPALPAWVEDWNAALPGSLPDAWHLDPGVKDLPGRPDDFAAESSRYGRSGDRPLRAGGAEGLADRLFHTPVLDEITLDFARELVERVNLGGGPQVDLLAVSLSATDAVGHLYGPESRESRDSLRRTDAALGRFLEGLEERVGSGRLLVALSSDHGVLPLPEWLSATGRSRCPVEGGRVGLAWLGLELLARLHFEFSPFAWPGPWLHFASYRATVDRERARRHGVSVDEVVAFTKAWAEREPAIAHVWTPREIADGRDEWARLYRNSEDPERSGDLTIQVEPTCLIYPSGEGTDHGTPYLYDREVPIVLRGPGVTPGVVAGGARTVDVAPTLARLLGLPLPGDLDGHPLPVR